METRKWRVTIDVAIASDIDAESIKEHFNERANLFTFNRAHNYKDLQCVRIEILPERSR
jgi:hypothetical protein